MSAAPVYGVVEASNESAFQTVALEQPHPTLGTRVFLFGAEKARGARAGDRVLLTYHSSRSMGRWMATKA